jgi:hypothetical protein
MNDLFAEPTSDNVKRACKEFDAWKDNPDPALTELFERYPSNSAADARQVLIKVVALNALYSTQIPVYGDRVPTVYEVARHIVEIDIDPKLAFGSVDLVHKIAYTTIKGKSHFNYSFATKYCSWHRHNSYPIWDSRVDLYLWTLRNREIGKTEGFRGFKRKELWQYPTFKEVIDEFRVHFQLTEFDYKEIDKFLYFEGTKLFQKDGPVETDSRAPF